MPLKKRAEAIADHLEKCQRTDETEDGRPRQIKQSTLKIQTAEQKRESDLRQKAAFNIEKLNSAVKLSKKGKVLGPDGIRMELIKWLITENRNWLINTINTWWHDKKAPEELCLARVATIYKKGETDKASN